MTVWVVIPWRAGCEHRQRAYNTVIQWWATNHPDWPVVVGEWPADRGPWRKGCAVRSAGIHPGPDDVVIVADADVIPVGIEDAVEAVIPFGWDAPLARWAVPFRMVYRLTELATEMVVSQGLDLVDPPRRDMRGLVEETYVGSAGGGAVVLRGDVFNEIPIDPRFAGYGQEDLSWSRALHRLVGAPGRRSAPLWHLWHPPQPRMRRGATVSQGVGSEESLRLWRRYRTASTPTAMRSLIGEAQDEFTHLMGAIDAGTH
jgi:hypothetical protein